MYPEHDRHAYYVTARDAVHVALLAGPFRTRQEAEALEDQCRAIIRERYAHDMRATFAGVGTTRLTLAPGQKARAGRFNGLVGAA